MRGPEFYRELIGKKFNSLTIEKLIGFPIESQKHTRAKFLCRCSCGKEKITILPRLRDGSVKSCGCKRIGHSNPNWRGFGDLSLTKWSQYKSGAAIRDLDFSIAITHGWELFLKQDGKCALSGIDISFTEENTASLDRIDSSKGYIEGNV